MATAEKEYKKNKAISKEDVKKLQEWAEKQPHLPEITELEFIIFLQCCYYSPEATKAALDNYFTMRTNRPDMFLHKDPFSPHIDSIMKVTMFTKMPVDTPDGYIITLGKFIDPNPSKYDMDSHLTMVSMYIDLLVAQHGTAEGALLLFDLEGLTLTHLTKINPIALRQFFTYLEDGVPMRIKAIHLLNAVSFVDKVTTALKSFMKNELARLVQTHQPGSKTIFEFVPKECLPIEYGGNLESILTLYEKERRNMQGNAEFYAKNTRTVDEKLRPGKTKFQNGSFGVDGTFKRLEID